MKTDELIERVRNALKAKDGRYPTDEERIDWVWGNVRLSNPEVTREMVEEAVRKANSQ